MISIDRLAFLCCALFLLHGGVAKDEALTVNLLNGTAENYVTYSIDLPTKEFMNFTAVRPNDACFSGNNTVYFSVGLFDDHSCSMALKWSKNHITFTKTGSPIHKFNYTDSGSAEFALSDDKLQQMTVTTVYNSTVNATTVGACQLGMTSGEYGMTHTVNFTALRLRADFPNCTEILFKFPGAVFTPPRLYTMNKFLVFAIYVGAVSVFITGLLYVFMYHTPIFNAGKPKNTLSTTTTN